MIVRVAKNVKVEPKAPSAPNFLFQNPKSSKEPYVHSDVPKKMLVPLIPNNGSTQKISGPCLIKGIRSMI